MSEYDFIDFNDNSKETNIVDKHLVVIIMSLFAGYFALFAFNKMITSNCFND